VRIAGIGYQGRSVDELVERLHAASITTLIDVREVPFSRRVEFAKTKLAARLAQAGIRYTHVPAAGNPKENRKSGDSPAVLARYRAHLAKTPGVLEAILAAAGGEPAALLCYEADPDACHRSVLLERLRAAYPELTTDDL
jgi:uncharacterized protein (DUF488 family)